MQKNPIIQTLFPSKYLSKKNTDYLYYKDLNDLFKGYFVFRLVHHRLIIVLVNLSALLTALINRIPFLRKIVASPYWIRYRRYVYFPSRLSEGVDLIFTNYHYPMNKVKSPVIIESDFSVFGASLDRRNKIQQLLYLPESIIERSTFVITRHEFSYTDFCNKYPHYKDKARIIPYYMPYLKFVSKDLVEQKWNGNGLSKIQILFVGHHAIRKGLVRLLHALSQIRTNHKFVFDFTVVSGFTDGAIEIPDWVKVYNSIPREEGQALMKKSHYFMMPTQEDAFGKVYIEALASGCILLSPDYYPLKEIFGKYGETVNVLSVSSITQGVVNLLNNSPQHLEWASSNVESVKNCYDPLLIQKKYIQLFNEAVDMQDKKNE